ncbi:hypothetical protein [Streptomyces sp. JJ38]|uniref:hypothetical protein n=1 Tax=Streptomyces sp. JJ38 TaxID=2738128 RepID=UPI001C584996|nr:hypothetical protein [Streptomyces sp. JJ38]MBW1597000.1 hypothetical protein [Streptomyces sp. JJ38]
MPERETTPRTAPQAPPFGELLASCAAARAICRPPREEPPAGAPRAAEDDVR